MILYHNTRCGKSRETLQLLKDNGHSPEIREYLKDELTQKELKEVIAILGIKAEELVRKSESIYKSQYKGKKMTELQWVKAMIDHPKLIQRPILVNGKKAAIGRPPENVLTIL